MHSYPHITEYSKYIHARKQNMTEQSSLEKHITETMTLLISDGQKKI